MNVIAIKLEPADEGEERAVCALRQRLAATLSFDRSAPDTYTFHITLAYFLRFPDASEKARLESLMTDEIQDMAKSGPLPRRAAGILSFQRYVRFLAPPVSAVNLLPGGALCGQYQACGFELSSALAASDP